MNKKLTADYWENRYLHTDTPWDIGSISGPLKDYFDQLEDKHQVILIPGAGKAHEAIYLHQQGFKEVYVCDWAASAFHHLETVAPDFPKDHIIIGDFFQLDLKVDLVVEQTFFCALSPSDRPAYVEKVHELLHPGGCLVGLLFASIFPGEGPPFGGNAAIYQALFQGHFHINQMVLSAQSIKPRLGNELFILMEKR